jgi:hypothetical protein
LIASDTLPIELLITQVCETTVLAQIAFAVRPHVLPILPSLVVLVPTITLQFLLLTAAILLTRLARAPDTGILPARLPLLLPDIRARLRRLARRPRIDVGLQRPLSLPLRQDSRIRIVLPLLLLLPDLLLLLCLLPDLLLLLLLPDLLLFLGVDLLLLLLPDLLLLLLPDLVLLLLLPDLLLLLPDLLLLLLLLLLPDLVLLLLLLLLPDLVLRVMLLLLRLWCSTRRNTLSLLFLFPIIWTAAAAVALGVRIRRHKRSQGADRQYRDRQSAKEFRLHNNLP